MTATQGGSPGPPEPPDPSTSPRTAADGDLSTSSGAAGEADQDGMGQNASSQQHLVNLQQQLEQSVLRSSVADQLGKNSIRSFDDLEDGLDGADELLFMASRSGGRQRGRSAARSGSGSPAQSLLDGDDSPKSKKRSKPRPASSYIPATAWAGQLSQLTFPSRKAGSRPSSSPSPSTVQQASTSSAPPPARSGIASPPRCRSSSCDAPGSAPPSFSHRRTSRASPTPSFRHSLRLPFLPSIPASPLPPILSPGITSTGLTRSASSPPLLPAISPGGAISPSFTLIPPTAGLHPSPSAWPSTGDDTSLDGPSEVTRPRRASSLGATRSGITTSLSAPNLSLLSTAPIDDPSSSSALSTSPEHSPYFPAVTASPDASTSASAAEPSFPSSSSSPPSPAAAPAAATAESPQLDSPQGLEFDPELLVADEEESDGETAKKVQEEKERAVRDEKRYHALVELVETEKGYLESLRVLVKVYFQTLPFLTLLTVAEVHAVVRNSEALLELHERIGERIEQVEMEIGWRKESVADEGKGKESEVEMARKARTAAGKIAEVFSEEIVNFELYNDFCARHAEALDITRSINSRQEWEAFERQCALRVSRGDLTPLASKNASSPFFPFSLASAPPSSSSPLPFTASPAPSLSTSPSHSSSAVPTVSSLSRGDSSLCSTSYSHIPSSSSASRLKLRFTDYAISPVQRITRYPLVFGQLAKYFASTPEHDAIRSTWEGFKNVAAGVDAAKRQREGEMRTLVVAQRMEFNTPLVGGAFCDVLGPTLLVGAMHVLRTGGSVGHFGSGAATVPGGMAGGAGGAEPPRVKYLGLFLYRTHLVMAKIKKRASYEPREWLPLRLFDVQNVEEGQGLLTNCIRLTFREHSFELGALCAGEKAIWLDQLLAAQGDARETWDTQSLDENGQPTLFDDTVVSSVPAKAPSPSPQNVPLPPSRGKSHSRTTSSTSVLSSFSSSGAGSPVLDSDIPLPPLPAELVSNLSASTSSLAAAPSGSPAPYSSSIMTTPQLSSRSRFSTTASSLLLGRTPSSQRAAVDLRLGDVFSEPLLSARAQAAREAAEDGHAASSYATLSAASAKRLRTASGPKRSMTALTHAAMPYAPYVVGADKAAKMLASGATLPGVPAAGGSRLERRRMSAVEMGTAATERAEFRGGIGFDVNASAVYRDASGFAPFAARAVSAGAGGASAATTTPERDRKGWASAIRKTKSSGGASTGAAGGPGGGKHRPALPEIDTALAETMARSSAGNKRGMSTPLSAGGSWSRRRSGKSEQYGGPSLGGQLRRVASHDSLATGRFPLAAAAAAAAVPTMLVLPNTPSTPTAATGLSSARTAPATDVERNNSVSSSASSNETGSRSSSSHASRLIETPPSSIPPSPDFGNIELVDPLACAAPLPLQPSSSNSSSALPARKPSFSTSPPTPQHHQISSASSSPRSVFDGMSSVFRLRRRKSTLGLVPPAVAPLSPNASTEHLAPVASRSPTLISVPSRDDLSSISGTLSSSPHVSTAAAANKALKLQRRASTTLTGLFSAKKRAQSSPALAGSGGYFNAAASSSPHLPLSSSTSPPGSSSSGMDSPSSSTMYATSPSASTTTSPATSQPPTPAGGTVVDLLPAPPPPPTMQRRKTSGPGGGGGVKQARQRSFFGMGMTPLS
ncbi:hypothetical protein JCM8547_007246 [Rhodosporidiobolus lusitaniae]